MGVSRHFHPAQNRWAVMLAWIVGAGCAAPDRPAVDAGPPEAATPPALDHVVASSEGGFRAAFSFEPAAIPLNEPFDVQVHLTDAHGHAADGTFTIDGRMPDHRHGMLRAPRIECDAEGVYTVRGMLFHMPGRWELHFDLAEDGVTERAVWEVELE